MKTPNTRLATPPFPDAASIVPATTHVLSSHVNPSSASCDTGKEVRSSRPQPAFIFFDGIFAVGRMITTCHNKIIASWTTDNSGSEGARAVRFFLLQHGAAGLL